MDKKLFIDLTEANFDEETFESKLPALVFFGAERCSVCKELQPVVEEIAEEYNGKLKVCWVDVDEYKSLIKRFRIRGIPHLIMFNNGEIKERISGLHEKEELINILRKYLKS